MRGGSIRVSFYGGSPKSGGGRRIILAGAAVAVALAALAAADDTASYLAEIRAAGVPAFMVPDARAVAGGEQVCSTLRAGMSPDQAAGMFGQLSGAWGPAVVHAAQAHLCPDTLH